ncbi:MAG: regulatory protein RecX [Candidatus Levybacteria bacterium]|nr:regulatory protein RecX [Candidatus Levybacteria bacterium]
MTVINRIIAKLKEQKFVNDEEFAKWWIEQRTNFKPRSLRLIKMELKQKGIDEELVQGSILRLRSGQSDLEMAKKLVQKRLQKYKNLPRQEIYQKLGRVLAQKGFSWDTIKESIDGVLTGEYN